MPWKTDPVSGKAVWVDEKTGKAAVRSRDGQYFQVDPSKVGDVLLSGDYEVATPDEVAEYRTARDATIGDHLRVAGESFARTGANIVTAPLQAAASAAGNERMAENLRGENIVSRMEAPGEFGVEAQQEKERMQREARAMPGSAMAGSAAAEVAGAALLPGGAALRGAGAAARVAAGAGRYAAEGAYFGGVQAVESAFIEDSELTAEKVMAHVGPAAFIGGLIGGGAGALSRARPRATSQAPETLEEVMATGRRTRAPEGLADDIADQAGPYRQGGAEAAEGPFKAVSDEAIGEQAGKLVDQPAAPNLGPKLSDVFAGIRETVETTQSAVTGAERETLRKFGVTRWDDSARSGRRMYAEREQILEGATKELTDEADVLVKRSNDVTDVVTSPAVKEQHVRRNLQELTAAQRQRALGEAQKVYATARDEILELSRGERARASAKGAKRSTVRGDRYLEDLNEWTSGIEAALKKGDEAEAYIAIDRTKRALQKKIDNIGKTLHRETNPLKLERRQMQMQKLEQTQEKLRNFLMADDVWGRQGASQKAVNQAWTQYIDRSKNFTKSFTRQMGREYGGFGGRRIYELDPDRVSSYVRQMGQQKGALTDRVFREYVDANRNLSRAIGDGYELEAAARGALSDVENAAGKIHRTLQRADETVRVVNQIDDVVQADIGGGIIGGGWLGGAVGGGLMGGPLGAMLGAAATIASSPGAMIKQMAAVESMARSLDDRMGGALSAYLKKATKKGDAAKPSKVPGIEGPIKGAAKKLARGAAKATGATGRGAVKAVEAGKVPLSIRLFQGDEEDLKTAYKKRAEDIGQSLANNAAPIRERAAEQLGELASNAPNLYGHIVDTGTRAALYLQAKMPMGSKRPTPLDPFKNVQVPEYQARSFARIWSAVQDPMSVFDDLERGTLTLDQVHAVKEVYPQLYAEMQGKALEMIRDASIAGDSVPFRAKLELDVLLNLNGAGDPTMSREFANKLDELRSAKAEEQAKAAPPPSNLPPPEAAKNRQSPLQQLEI